MATFIGSIHHTKNTKNGVALFELPMLCQFIEITYVNDFLFRKFPISWETSKMIDSRLAGLYVFPLVH